MDTQLGNSLRTCPPSLILNATTLFDNLIREALEDITGGSLSDWSWAKANLPCSMGGLNLRSAVLRAPATYISSIAESIDLASQILCYTPNLPLALPMAISSLAYSVNRPCGTIWKISIYLSTRNHFVD